MPETIEAPVITPVQEPTVKDPKFNDFMKLALKPVDETRKPDMYACVLHNDNTTPGPWVVGFLVEAYGLDPQKAMNIMMNVHRGRRGVIIILPESEARERTDKALAMAHAANCDDFTITIEKETDGE